MNIKLNLLVCNQKIEIEKFVSGIFVKNLEELKKLDEKQLKSNVPIYFIDTNLTKTEKDRQNLIKKINNIFENDVLSYMATTIVSKEDTMPDKDFDYPTLHCGYKKIKVIVEDVDKIPDLEPNKENIDFIKGFLNSKNPSEYIYDALKTGVLEKYCPSLASCFQYKQHSEYHMDDTIGDHIMRVVKEAKNIIDKCENTDEKTKHNNDLLLLAALYHDAGKYLIKSTDIEGEDHFLGHPDASARLLSKELKMAGFSNEDINFVKKLVILHETRFQANKNFMLNYIKMNKLSADEVTLLALLMTSDVLGQGGIKYKNNPNLLNEYLKTFSDSLSIAYIIFEGYNININKDNEYVIVAPKEYKNMFEKNNETFSIDGTLDGDKIFIFSIKDDCLLISTFDEENIEIINLKNENTRNDIVVNKINEILNKDKSYVKIDCNSDKLEELFDEANFLTQVQRMKNQIIGMSLQAIGKHKNSIIIQGKEYDIEEIPCSSLIKIMGVTINKDSREIVGIDLERNQEFKDIIKNNIGR